MNLIKVSNKEDMDEVIQFMIENNIIFKQQSGYESFILEESASMLEVAIGNNQVDSCLTESEIGVIADDIADTLFLNYGGYIDDAYTYEIAEEVLRKYINGEAS